MMAAKSRGRPSPRPGGGSRILTYILIAMIAGLVGYYVVLPAFVPRTTTTTTIPGTSSVKIKLNPGTDISGASVTLSGSGLAANKSVSVTFGTLTVGLNGTCTTSSSGELAGCLFWVPKMASGSYTVTVSATAASKGTATFHIPQYSPPISTVLVTLTSVALGLTTQLVTRRVVDLDAERKMKAEVNAFNKEKREATLANDKVKLDKLKKRQLQVTQAQAKLSTARLKVTAITFIPLLGVYYLMATFLGGYGVIVAYTPIPIPVFAGASQYSSFFQVSLFWWYFLSSFAFSTMLGKVLHTTT